jgi:hypothetical protein
MWSVLSVSLIVPVNSFSFCLQSVNHSGIRGSNWLMNSFSFLIRLESQIPKSRLIILEIYDILGLEITTMINQLFLAGQRQFRWDARDIPSGIYIYRVRAEGFVKTKKMLLVR